MKASVANYGLGARSMSEPELLKPLEGKRLHQKGPIRLRRRGKSLGSDLAMCSVSGLSSRSFMMSLEAVTRAYPPHAGLEAKQTRVYKYKRILS
ncbi:hypothetical protein RHMOL_Rhmol11G0020200 [Rhododendron molle]|uniref:Uncharacterized protein n=1 Tax=Rhododendron molle TaxID=49168 RepID=A0ACC0LP04_RHOML|nr:hypothetical protein RHMOL_Rhmol11G0020200 [Rhododendron molle]